MNDLLVINQSIQRNIKPFIDILKWDDKNPYRGRTTTELEQQFARAKEILEEDNSEAERYFIERIDGCQEFLDQAKDKIEKIEETIGLINHARAPIGKSTMIGLAEKMFVDPNHAIPKKVARDIQEEMKNQFGDIQTYQFSYGDITFSRIDSLYIEPKDLNTGAYIIYKIFLAKLLKLDVLLNDLIDLYNALKTDLLVAQRQLSAIVNMQYRGTYF